MTRSPNLRMTSLDTNMNIVKVIYLINLTGGEAPLGTTFGGPEGNLVYIKPDPNPNHNPNPKPLPQP